MQPRVASICSVSQDQSGCICFHQKGCVPAQISPPVCSVVWEMVVLWDRLMRHGLTSSHSQGWPWTSDLPVWEDSYVSCSAFAVLGMKPRALSILVFIPYIYTFNDVFWMMNLKTSFANVNSLIWKTSHLFYFCLHLYKHSPIHLVWKARSRWL